MCFSANASFIAGSVLTVAGIVSLSQVSKPKQLSFAVIPLFFGIQQFCEGFLWLSLTGNGYDNWHTPMKYLFLIFAQVIWPFWIPLAFLLLEPSPKRKKILRYFVFAGIVVSLLLAWRLVFYIATARIDGCHVDYSIASPPGIKIFTAVFYLGAIVIAPLLSTVKRVWILASVNVVSLTVTYICYQAYFVSIWCFFAAVQSMLIVFILRRIRMLNTLK